MKLFKTLGFACALSTVFASGACAQMQPGATLLGVASGIGQPIPNGPGVPPPGQFPQQPGVLPPPPTGVMPPAPGRPNIVAPGQSHLTAAIVAVECFNRGDSEFERRTRMGIKRAILVKIALGLPWNQGDLALSEQLFTRDEMEKARRDLPAAMQGHYNRLNRATQPPQPPPPVAR